MNQSVRYASCACGKVRCEAVGKPIFAAVCYCDDCQAGGRQVEALSDAKPVLDPDGGAAYLAFLDGRFQCVEGEELLVGYKLKEKSPTTRYVASCCNTGMYLKFGPGFWVSAYRRNFGEAAPPLEWRNQTKFRSSDLPMPDDLPAFHRFPMRLFTKLIGARIAKVFGR